MYVYTIYMCKHTHTYTVYTYTQVYNNMQYNTQYKTFTIYIVKPVYI